MEKITKNSIAKKIILIILVFVLTIVSITPKVLGLSEFFSILGANILLKPLTGLVILIVDSINSLVSVIIGSNDYADPGSSDNFWSAARTTIISPEEIFQGDKVPITNVNILEDNYGADHEGTNEQLIFKVRQGVKTLYLFFRNLCAISMLAVLIYIGIMIIINNNNAQAQSKWKQRIIQWLVGLALVMFVHVLLLALFYFSRKLIELLSFNYSGENLLDSIAENYLDSWNTFTSGTVVINAVMYCVASYTMWVFAIAYFKRFMFMTVMIVIAPIFGVLYATGNFGKQRFNHWLREVVAGVLVQPFHLLVFYVLFYFPMSLLQGDGQFHFMSNPSVSLYALMAILMIRPIEKFLRQLAGLSSTTLDNVASYESGKKTIDNGVNVIVKGAEIAAMIALTGGAGAGAAGATASTATAESTAEMAAATGEGGGFPLLPGLPGDSPDPTGGGGGGFPPLVGGTSTDGFGVNSTDTPYDPNAWNNYGYDSFATPADYTYSDPEGIGDDGEASLRDINARQAGQDDLNTGNGIDANGNPLEDGVSNGKSPEELDKDSIKELTDKIDELTDEMDELPDEMDELKDELDQNKGGLDDQNSIGTGVYNPEQVNGDIVEETNGTKTEEVSGDVINNGQIESPTGEEGEFHDAEFESASVDEIPRVDAEYVGSYDEYKNGNDEEPEITIEDEQNEDKDGGKNKVDNLNIEANNVLFRGDRVLNYGGENGVKGQAVNNAKPGQQKVEADKIEMKDEKISQEDAEKAFKHQKLENAKQRVKNTASILTSPEAMKKYSELSEAMHGFTESLYTQGGSGDSGIPRKIFSEINDKRKQNVSNKFINNQGNIDAVIKEKGYEDKYDNQGKIYKTKEEQAKDFLKTASPFAESGIKDIHTIITLMNKGGSAENINNVLRSIMNNNVNVRKTEKNINNVNKFITDKSNRQVVTEQVQQKMGVNSRDMSNPDIRKQVEQAVNKEMEKAMPHIANGIIKNAKDVVDVNRLSDAIAKNVKITSPKQGQEILRDANKTIEEAIRKGLKDIKLPKDSGVDPATTKRIENLLTKELNIRNGTTNRTANINQNTTRTTSRTETGRPYTSPTGGEDGMGDNFNSRTGNRRRPRK